MRQLLDEEVVVGGILVAALVELAGHRDVEPGIERDGAHRGLVVVVRTIDLVDPDDFSAGCVARRHPLIVSDDDGAVGADRERAPTAGSRGTGARVGPGILLPSWTAVATVETDEPLWAPERDQVAVGCRRSLVDDVGGRTRAVDLPHPGRCWYDRGRQDEHDQPRYAYSNSHDAKPPSKCGARIHAPGAGLIPAYAHGVAPARRARAPWSDVGAPG